MEICKFLIAYNNSFIIQISYFPQLRANVHIEILNPLFREL